MDGALVASRNIRPFVIQSNNLALANYQIDRFIPNLINADLLADNSIVSDNIVPESLTFDILQENDLSDFVPDGFFQSIL